MRQRQKEEDRVNVLIINGCKTSPGMD